LGIDLVAELKTHKLIPKVIDLKFMSDKFVSVINKADTLITSFNY